MDRVVTNKHHYYVSPKRKVLDSAPFVFKCKLFIHFFAARLESFRDLARNRPKYYFGRGGGAVNWALIVWVSQLGLLTAEVIEPSWLSW